MKQLIVIAVCIFTIGICNNRAFAQYTLTDNDVQVVNGSIVKCTYNFSNTSIVIPDSLDGQKIIEIGSEAFQYKDGIPQITQVSFPEGLEKIGNAAFTNNQILSVTIPSTLKSIGANAFESNKLTTLTIPANVQAIGESAFHDNDIATLTLNEGLLKIGSYAFNNNEITSLVIPNSVTDLGYCAFQINRISDLTIGSGVKHIGHRTFWENELTTLAIPEGVVNIEGGAFSNNRISNLTIPSSVTSIWEGPFNNNEITMINGEPSNGIIYGRNHDGSKNISVIQSYGGVADVIDFIPESVTNIGGNSFSFNGLTSVTIPATVKTIHGYAFTDNEISTLNLPEGLQRIEGMAFFNNELTNLNLPSSVNYLGGGVFNMNTITTLNGEATNGLFYARNTDGSDRVTKVVSYAGANKAIAASLFSAETDTIGHSAFQNSKLTSVELPNSILIIEDWAFEQNLITSVNLPEGLIKIKYNAFSNNKLSTVSIPNSVTVLGQGAFQNNLLTSVTLPNAISDLKAWVLQNNKLTSIDIPSSVTYIGDGALASNQLSSITIKSAVTQIGSGAFASNKLTSLNIPENVEKISHSCFTENNLTSLILNEGLKILGDGVFMHNQLTQSDISIPKSVSSIGTDAFANNSGIDSIYLHQPTVSGFKKWVDGYGVDQRIDTWVKDLGTSYIADVELTLSDNDIIIENGYIQSVNYDIRANKITIPRILQDQVVIGIRDNYWDEENQADVGGVFENKSIISINLPTSLIHIGGMAFYENNLSEVLIPDSTRYIGRDAFSQNTELTSIDLPNPSDPNFIEWTDHSYNKYIGGQTVYSLDRNYRAQYRYTLTDNDVEMKDGAIISCSYNFMDKNIVIPEELDGQKVIAIREIWMENEEGHMEPFGIFQNKSLNSVQLPATLDTIAHNSFAWNELTTINLPEGIKYLAHGAFHSNKLDSVTIRDSVRYIGAEAFSFNRFSKIKLPNPQSDKFVYWYTNENKQFDGGDYVSNFSIAYTALYKYTLTDADVEMENGAIVSCNYDFSSKYLIIPETLDGQKVTSMREVLYEDEHGAWLAGIFSNKNLIAVDLPSTLDSICPNAFYGNKLNYIKLPDGVVYIGRSAFADNALDSVDMQMTIPSSESVFNRNQITKLNGKSFNGLFYKVDQQGITDSTTIVSYGGNHDIIDFIPEMVLHIDIHSFGNCNFSQVSLTTQIQTIGDFAFSSGGLSSINIPNSVTYIGMGAFQESVIQEFTLPTPQSEDFLYWYDYHNPKGIYQPGDVVTDLESSYTALVKYVLTDNDVVVENGAIINHSYDYRSAFIEIPDTLDGQEVIAIREIMREEVDENGETFEYMAGMFQPIDHNRLIAIILPASLDSLYNNTFAYNDIDSIYISDGLEYIGNAAFQENRLNSIILPNSLNYIGGWAFESNNLEHFILPNPEGDDFFYWLDYDMNQYQGGIYVSDLQKTYIALAKYILKDSDVVMENNAMKSISLNFQYKYLVIPDTLDGQEVHTIESYTVYDDNGSYKMGLFQGWDDNVLLGLELPKTLNYIDNNTFYWNKIDTVTLPKGLKHIGSGAFQNSGLTNITLPDSVQFIGHGAFVENSFNEITLPNPDSDDFVFWYTPEDDRYDGGASTSDLWNEFKALYKYTLTDDDVVVENGSIIESTYDFHAAYIVIPEELDGQEVVKIDVIQNGDEYIGMFQGQDDKQLVGVDLPATLDTIEMFAFAGNQIQIFALPEGIIYIGDGALRWNNLPNIDIPYSTTYIGEAAFADNAPELNSFILPSSIETMHWIDGAGNIHIGGEVTDLYTWYELVDATTINNYMQQNCFVYPNPAVNVINIANLNSLNNNLKIYNISGKLVYQAEYNLNERINISHLESGLYYLNIIDENKNRILNKSFIKK